MKKYILKFSLICLLISMLIYIILFTCYDIKFTTFTNFFTPIFTLIGGIAVVLTFLENQKANENLNQQLKESQKANEIMIKQTNLQLEWDRLKLHIDEHSKDVQCYADLSKKEFWNAKFEITNVKYSNVIQALESFTTNYLLFCLDKYPFILGYSDFISKVREYNILPNDKDELLHFYIAYESISTNYFNRINHILNDCISIYNNREFYHPHKHFIISNYYNFLLIELTTFIEKIIDCSTIDKVMNSDRTKVNYILINQISNLNSNEITPLIDIRSYLGIIQRIESIGVYKMPLEYKEKFNNLVKQYTDKQ